MQKVELIIKELGLTKCADTQVGTDMIKGISGGEKKRLSVGVELITDPSFVPFFSAHALVVSCLCLWALVFCRARFHPYCPPPRSLFVHFLLFHSSVEITLIDDSFRSRPFEKPLLLCRHHLLG